MRRVTVLLILILNVATGLLADENHAIRIDSRVGFGGVFRPGRWTPVELTLQNLGPSIRGTLIVTVDRRDRFGPDRHANSYLRELDLAAGAVKGLSFTLPLQSAVYPLQVRIRSGEDLLVEEEVKLAGRGANNSIVAVLSRSSSLDFLLPAFNDSDRRAMDLVYPLVEYLPRSWHGYDGLDLLVVHDARLGAMDDAQITAIREWVAAGGHLVVSAGAHLSPSDSKVVEQLTGLTPDGVVVLRAEELGLEEAGLTVVEAERDALSVATSFANAGAKSSAVKLGRGSIVVLPFDYRQFVRVAPVTSLGMWISLLPRDVVLGEDPAAAGNPGIVPISISRRVFETDLLANQLDLPLYNFPSRLLVAGLILSFLVVAAGVLLWSSRHTAEPHARVRRPAIGVIAIVAIAAITSLVSHLTLNVGKQPSDALAFSLEIAEMRPDDGYAMATRDIALFSRKRTNYEITFPGGPVIVPLDSSDQIVHNLNQANRLEVPVDRWGYRNTVAMQVRRLDIRARLHRGIGYTSVEIANRSSMPLGSVVVLAGGFPTAVSNVEPGEIVEHVVMGSGVGNWDEIPWADYVPEGELSRHQAQLLRDLGRRQRDTDGPGSALIVGWTPTPLVEAELPQGFTRVIELNAVTIRADAPGGME